MNEATTGHVSYSFEGEDSIIASLMRDVNDGTFVDVGCNHPIIYNNTYMLYQRGWRGIAIDANGMFAEDWAQKRAGDTFIEALLSDEEKEVTFSRWSDHTMSTCDPDTTERYSGRLGVPVEQKVSKTRTLEGILDQNSDYSGTEIHVLCIDVEGEDLNVLRGINMKRWRPGLIVVEAKLLNLSNLSSHPVAKLMHIHGYRLIAKTPLDSFFIDPKKPYFTWLPRQLYSEETICFSK